MTGFKLIHLRSMVRELGEERVKQLLSTFSCPLNSDVENFLRVKSIEFANQSLAQTHLVFASHRKSAVLVGYFTLANKHITIKAGSISRRIRDRVKRFATYDSAIGSYCLAAPLIAQLGKNYNNEANKLITGDELLKIACDKVSMAQLNIGGKFVYLECEDKPRLLDFYESNGFCVFDRRPLDQDETGLDGEYLIQLLKYLR